MQTGNSKYKTIVTESITKDTNMSLHFFSPVLSGLCRRAVSRTVGLVWGHRTGRPLNHVFKLITLVHYLYNVSTNTITVRLGI